MHDRLDSPRFEFIAHTADIGVVAYGADLREVFANAAYAMTSIMADPDEVRESWAQEIEVEAPDREVLLVEWLNEFLFLFDAQHLVFRRFVVHDLEESRLRATAWGENVDPARHHLRTAIKAITYHLLRVACDDAGCQGRVVFDI